MLVALAAFADVSPTVHDFLIQAASQLSAATCRSERQ